MRTASDEVVIRHAAITSDAAVQLILALNAELSERYPEPGANHFRLDADEVAPGRGVFLIAYQGDTPVACGAIRVLKPGTAEVKRMYVVPALRGHRLGKRILEVLEEEARWLGAQELVLETGDRQPEALALYARAGFLRVEPFGEYETSPLSVCMRKAI